MKTKHFLFIIFYALLIPAWSLAGAYQNSPNSAVQLAAPVLTAIPISSSGIDLHWVDNNTRSSGFEIERSLDPASGFVKITTTESPVLSYSDSGLASGTKYYYRMRTFLLTGKKLRKQYSPYSNTANTATQAAVDNIAPSVPQNLTAIAASCSEISLPWNASTDTGGSGLAGYKVYRNGAYLKLVTDTTTTDTGLSASTTYSYQVSAIDNAGNESVASNTAITYTPSCAIPVGYEELTPLTFNSKYIVQSDTPATTTSSTFVDDPEAVSTFTLNDTQTILALYQAHNDENTALGYWGIGHAIAVDSVDHSKSYDTPSIPGQSARNQIFWIGTLGPGQHVVKGRFASPDNLSTVTINDRILLIYVFNGSGYRFIESSAVRTTTSGLFIDDNESVINFYPSENGKALYLYNVNKATPAAAEWIAGKKAAISVSSVDYSQAEKSTNGGNTMDSVFTLHAENVISHTPVAVKGRWASNIDAEPVQVDYSQFGVLFFDDRVLMDFVQSDNSVSTASDPLVDDPEATIQRSISEDRDLLVIAMATTREGTESERKLNYGISVDSVDGTLARATSDGVGAFANSAATSWGETLYPGAHVIQGRFSSGGGTAYGGTYVDSRRIVAFWFQ